MSIVVDAARHGLPLVSVYLLRADVATYLVLTAFDLALGLWLNVVTTRDRGDRTTVDPRSRWLISRVAAVLVGAVLLAILAVIFTIPIVLPALVLGTSAGVDWQAVLGRPSVWIPVAGMSLLAAGRFQGAFEATTTPGKVGSPWHAAPVIGNPEEDRRRSLAVRAIQVTLIATFACLCLVLLIIGRWGLNAFPIVYAALQVFYDVRPDVAQRISPTLWRAARGEPND